MKVLQLAFVADFIVDSHAVAAALSRPGGQQYSSPSGKTLGVHSADKDGDSNRTAGSPFDLHLSACSHFGLAPLCRHVMRVYAHKYRKNPGSRRDFSVCRPHFLLFAVRCCAAACSAGDARGSRRFYATRIDRELLAIAVRLLRSLPSRFRPRS